MANYQPATRLRLGDQLYEQILQRIVTGEYPEGARLPSEKALSEAFGVSRPIVREALSRLQVDGLVQARQGSGTYVRGRPNADFFTHAPRGAIAAALRFFELRMALEGDAAYHAAQRRNDADMQRIISINQKLESIIGAGEVGTDLDIELHEAISIAAHNEIFLRCLRSERELFEAGLRMTRNLSLHKQLARQTMVQQEHQAIIHAIEHGNPDSARTAMRYHIDNARIRLVSDAD